MEARSDNQGQDKIQKAHEKQVKLFWKAVEGRIGQINVAVKKVLNQMDFNSYAAYLGLIQLYEENCQQEFLNICTNTVEDMSDEEITSMGLNLRRTLSPGQQQAIKALMRLFERMENGDEPGVYRELTGKLYPGVMNVQDINTEPIKDSSASRSAPSVNRNAVTLTAMNVELQLCEYLSTKLSREVNNIKVLKRSTGSYPFNIKIECFKCSKFQCNVRVVKEKVRQREFTRFRAETYIKHIKECNA